MKRSVFASLFVLGFLANAASAVEIRNVRPCHGPFGATRTDLKLLPGDVLFITYDVEGLMVDPKTGKTNYETTLEFLDANDPKNEKVLFKKPTTNEVVPLLGGGRMPGDLHLIMGAQQAPGKYKVKLTVHDKIAKDAKAFSMFFDVLPQGFGFVGVTVPAIGFPGQHYVAGFGVVNLALDGKGQPKADVTISILDAKGAPVTPAVKIELPRDLPLDQAGNPIDLKQSNFVPLQYPIFLNRPGHFTVEIRAQDKFGNKTAELRYPLNVLDVNQLIGK
jgi:hypothetical protein